MNPWLGIAGVLAILGLINAVGGLARRRGWLQPEDARKLVHVALGIVIAAFPWIFSELWPVVTLAGLAVAALLPLRLMPALRARHGAALHDVQRDSLGELYFPVAAAVIWCLAPGDPLRFSIPMLVLASADAAAAVVGVRYGRTELTGRSGRKSWEGAVAFGVTAYLAVHAPLLLFSDLGRAECLLIAATFGMLMTGVEAVSWRGLDNLFIPLVGWLLLDSWLGLPAPALAGRLGMSIGLCLFVAALRRRRTLDDGALAAGMLAAFVAGAVGGWHWLVPPMLLFLGYTVIWRLPPGAAPRHDSRVALAVVLPGLCWLAAGQLGLSWRSAFAGYAAAWAAAAACVGVATLWTRSRPLAVVSGSLAGPLIALAAWLAAGCWPADLRAMALVALAALPAAALFALVRPRLALDSPTRWSVQCLLPLACSPLPLLAGIPPS
jgi:phytol kinase